MKVALCCIGRLENRYIVEYVEYYKNIGVDKIFLYDNNYNGEENFEDVIGNYVNNGFVEIVDFRNKKNCQLMAYQDCYDKHGNEYDWICFFDIDEYLTFNDNFVSIKDFLKMDCFSNYDMIHINWKVYGDNDLVHYEEKPLTERFLNPVMPLDFCKTYDFPQNCHIKSIIKGGINVEWNNTPHTTSNVLKCCNSDGKECDSTSPFVIPYTFKNAFIKHFVTKTIEEFNQNKVKRGYPDGNYDFFKKNSWIDDFFKINKVTEEKINYIKSLRFYNEKNIDIFICTHKEFNPPVKNEIYKQINCNDINNDTWNGLKGSFYSEIMSYFYIAENYKLKDYIGFCHYRKYWAFMDNIPDVNEIFRNYDVIVAKPIMFKYTAKQQYKNFHNIEDLYIVGGIIADKYPEYINAYSDFMSGNMLLPYNMFIMRKENFLEYISFVKGVLDEYVNVVGKDIEKRIENNKDKYLKNYYPNNTIEYQYRIGGYLGERLTHMFFLKKFKKLKAYPVIITEDKYK